MKLKRLHWEGEKGDRLMAERVFVRDRYQCQRCYARPISQPVCLHVVPLSQGGRHTSDNLETLCGDCAEAVLSMRACRP